MKKEYSEYKNEEKQKLIDEIMGIQKQRKNIKKAKSKPRKKVKTKKSKPEKNIKTFDDYFLEYIKNKTIPQDTPKYLRKDLERAMREYQVGIKLEKSALDNFAEKYVIKGKPKILPKDYFKEKASQLKIFLRNHRNIKVRIIMVCLMGQKTFKDGEKIGETIDKAYFHSQTYVNLKGTNIKEILFKIIKEILKVIPQK